MSGWDNFFVAQAGAAAALAGLIFVAVSLNLKRVLELPGMPGRAFETVMELLALLVVAMLGLVPGQPGFAWALVAIGGVATTTATLIQLRSRRVAVYWMVRLISTQVPLALVGAAGVALLVDRSPAGWLASGVICGFGGAMINGWVLLVEIQR